MKNRDGYQHTLGLTNAQLRGETAQQGFSVFEAHATERQENRLSATLVAALGVCHANEGVQNC